MSRFAWFVAGVVTLSVPSTASISPVVARSATDSIPVSPPDSLSLAGAATYDDTLAVLDRTLRAFEGLGKALPNAGVFTELVAAMRESYAAGDVEAAAILSDDAWELLRSEPR